MLLKPPVFVKDCQTGIDDLHRPVRPVFVTGIYLQSL